MKLKQKIRELNWKRNFAVKRLKLRFKFALYNFSKVFLPIRSKHYDLKQVKKILIIRNDRIGDMIVTTGLIRNLHESGYDVYVSSRAFSLDIIKYNPYVKGTFIYDDSSFKHLYKSIKNVRKEKFDLAVEVRCNRMIHLSNIIFCSYVKTKILVGYNKSSLPSFNISIPYYQPNDHVTNQLLCFLNLLKIKNNDMQYQLFNDDNEENKSELFLKKTAIFNPFGSMPNRHFSIEQIEAICHILIKKYDIIIIGEKTMLENIKEIKKVTFFNSSCILDTIPLIKNSDLIISVDTSIVHIATCFAKKTISFYLDISIKKPIQDDVKGCYNFNLHLLKSTLEDKFHDGKYLRKNNLDRTIPINHKVWAPNNKNCIQLIFDYDEIRNIPIDELSVTTTNSLLKIAY